MDKEAQTGMMRITLIVVALYAICCAMALGQKGPDAAAPLRSNGGSLLRATLATQPDPAQAPLSSISFFAVPEPEPRMIQRHDLVTIIVREQSEFSSEGSQEFRKQAALDARLDELVRINLARLEIGPGELDPLTLRASGSRDSRGEASVDRSDSFITRLTAEVVDVKPNGTLVLQARRRIKTDDEVQNILLTGICRAEDITPDNTILSTQMYDLRLDKTHRGGVRNATRRGLLPKLLDAVNPF
jgi:flagellar L-ring protein FlgH